MSMPAIILNSSPARWEADPVPNDAMVILPGLALASAIRSATVLAGTDGFATITMGKETSPATGAMSRCRLNGKVEKMCVLTTDEAPRNSSV